MYAALRRHPSIWIVPLLAVLVLVTGGIVGVMTAAATETRQARLNAEGEHHERQLQQRVHACYVCLFLGVVGCGQQQLYHTRAYLTQHQSGFVCC
jgi:hypothetical protein